MPTYEYRCRECGREFDVFQRMSDKPGAPCPDCASVAERLISGGAGLLFKGDGFYITDYRSDDYRKKASEEAGAGADKDGSKGGKSKSSSSSDSSKPSDGNSDGATKAALIGLTRTWALELGGDGVTVNCICPGPTATELYVNANPPDSPRTKAALAAIPADRIGTPEDMAHAIAFFLDERGSFVTGQAIMVCGGSSLGARESYVSI